MSNDLIFIFDSHDKCISVTQGNVDKYLSLSSLNINNIDYFLLHYDCMCHNFFIDEYCVNTPRHMFAIQVTQA